MGQGQGIIIGRTEAAAEFRILLDIPLPRPHREEPLELQLQCLLPQRIEDGREGPMGELYTVARRSLSPARSKE
jgi:hypothetical protein